MAQTYIDGEYTVTVTASGSVIRELTTVHTVQPAPVDPCQFLLDVGPFMDRAGAAKLPILTSTDATVKAIIQDMMARKWIDLQRADVATSLGYIGSVVAALTPALQTAILTAPVSAEENRALRKLYFS